MDGDGWFERWSQRTGTQDMRVLKACGFFDPYTMVVYLSGMFVYVDDNIVGYIEGLCDIFKKAPSERSNVSIKEEEVLAKQGRVAAGSEGLGAGNEDCFNEMIRQISTQNENILSNLKTYKEMAVKNKEEEEDLVKC
ncbi:hypothetical protein QYF36_024844 [Acer negundo]|nr:hypothetical protein QYF36_024844 [Acer negundo]